MPRQPIRSGRWAPTASAAELVNDMLAGLSDEEIRAGEAALHESCASLLHKVPMGEYDCAVDRNASHAARPPMS